MNEFEIFFFTDNSHGEALAAGVVQKGLSVRICNFKDIGKISWNNDQCSIFIFDIEGIRLVDLIKQLSVKNVSENIIKLIITENREMDSVFFNSVRPLRVEFILKPVDETGFITLLEKILLVEKYKKTMKHISDESDFRIQILDYIVHPKKNEILDEFTERENFIRILDFEKKLIEEHHNLNETIRNIVLSRNNEYYSLKDRIKAEEMLDVLRREELINANRIIEVQGYLIEYSSRELMETQRIMGAMKNVEELSRTEAIDLHKELDRLKDEKEVLENRINSLKSE